MGYIELTVTAFLCCQATNFAETEYQQVKKLLGWITKKQYSRRPIVSCMLDYSNIFTKLALTP